MFEDPSGLPHAYNRVASDPNRARIIFQEQAFVQAADLNELQSLEARRNMRVGNLIASNGDRVSDATIVVGPFTGTPPVCTLTLSAGTIFVRGDVRPVSAATIAGVAATGTVIVGVRLLTTTTTYLTDPTLLGLDPGTWAEGQPGAGRQAETISWALSTDGAPGDFYPVYTLVNGAPLDQTPPPDISGVNAAIAQYDSAANGNYIVSGCEVTALGKTGTAQGFSINSGEANILGFKRTRSYALTVTHTEDPDLEAVAAEPHTFGGPGTVITVNRAPIASVTSVVVVKQVTETVVRGSTPGGTDALTNPSVVSIVSVVQGATTYHAPADYVLGVDAVSWAPSGAEPAASSTYQVTYQYNASVVPDAITTTTVTVSGGVAGTTCLVSYISKIPRIDLLCLDSNGNAAYVNGVSARFGALAPLAPSTLLKLAEVSNDWLNTPVISNNGTHNVPYDLMQRYFYRLVTMLNQFDRVALQGAITAANPTAKQGIFTDTFDDDSYRDQGSAQTAATVGGTLQLAVDLLSTSTFLTTPLTMAWTEEVIVRQDLATSSMFINPFANLTRMPAAMTLQPPVDFWTDSGTVWTSPATQEFSTPPAVPTIADPSTTTINEVVSVRSEIEDTLRQSVITYTLSGFGAGENLSVLTFAGISVLPGGTVTADGNGHITGSFTIPANVPSGTQTVNAVGAAGSFASALFVGQGTVDITTMQQVTLVQRLPQPINLTQITNNITNNTTNVTNVTNVTDLTSVTQNVQNVYNTINNVVSDPNAVRPTGGGDHGDPLGTTFTPPVDRCILGMNFKFTAIGNATRGVRVQLVTTQTGFPTDIVLAEAFIDMTTVTVGQWVNARFAAPVFVAGGTEYAFVLMTDDPTHSVAISKTGDVDPTTQTFVGAQPYTAGALVASPNHSTWTLVGGASMTFEVVAANFSQTTLTQVLGTVALAGASDIVARASVSLPDTSCTFRFELVRADGSVVKMAPDQTIQFTNYVTETATLRVVLGGSTYVAPVLFPYALFAQGAIRASGTYITRAFQFGNPVQVTADVYSLLPSGSGLTCDCDATDNNWQSMAASATGVLGGGWVDRSFQKASFVAAEGRIRLTLTGSPAARPSLDSLRAYTI